jgi:isoamylase
VPGVQSGQIYAYRVHGLFDSRNGLRFDHDKTLLDPYGRGIVVPNDYSRDAASKPGENTAAAMKSVVTRLTVYDREGRHTAKSGIIADNRIRDARPRLYASSQFRRG